MEYVEAFREVKDINALKRYFKSHSERDYCLFVFGINTGLKINEILEIKVCDVMKEDGSINEFYELPDEDRTDQFYLNAKVQVALKNYIVTSQLGFEQYLFLSAKTQKPITRQQTHRIIHLAVEKVAIKGKYGASSMRKTFGYHAFKQGVSISLIQKHFHHATPSETLKYLGISKEEQIKTIIDVNL